jgi:membrane protein DedA with SNARE-associated domain
MPKARTLALKSRVLAGTLAAVIVGLVLAVLVGDIVEDSLIEGANIGLPFLTNIFSYVVQGALSVISGSGYYGIFFLMLLESSSFPIPSEVILPFAGYLASQGHLNLLLIISVTTAAGLAGSLIDYYVGFLLGVEGIKRLRRLPIKKGHLESAVKWFDTYGLIVVFGSRLIPGFRTLVSFPAGIVRMRLTKFLSYTALGCVLWNTILVYTGFYAGVHWEAAVSVIRPISIVAVVTIPSALILYYALIKRRRGNRQNDDRNVQ